MCSPFCSAAGAVAWLALAPAALSIVCVFSIYAPSSPSSIPSISTFWGSAASTSIIPPDRAVRPLTQAFRKAVTSCSIGTDIDTHPRFVPGDVLENGIDLGRADRVPRGFHAQHQVVRVLGHAEDSFGSAHHKMRSPILKGSHEPFLPAQVQRRFLGTGLILPQITWTARSEDEDLS